MSSIFFKGFDKPTNPNLEGLKKGHKAVLYTLGFTASEEAGHQHTLPKLTFDVVTIDSIDGHQGKLEELVNPDKDTITKDFVDQVSITNESGKTYEGLFGEYRFKDTFTGRTRRYTKHLPDNDPWEKPAWIKYKHLVSLDHFINTIIPEFKEKMDEKLAPLKQSMSVAEERLDEIAKFEETI